MQAYWSNATFRSHVIEAGGSSELGMYLLGFSLTAALLDEWCVFARRGGRVIKEPF